MGTAGDPGYAALLDSRVRAARDQQAALLRAVGDMRLARSLTVSDDEHDPEGSTVSLDQARDVALLEGTERTLAELEAAQRRLAEGSYGSCESCGRPIAAARLLARPEARLCLECATRAARSARRR